MASDIGKIVKEAEAFYDNWAGPLVARKHIRSLLDVVKELRQELALDGEPYTDREKHLARISELEQQLAEAAQEINCAGTVAHRIRILKKEHSEQFSAKDAEIVELKRALESEVETNVKIGLFERQTAAERDVLRAALEDVAETEGSKIILADGMVVYCPVCSLCHGQKEHHSECYFRSIKVALEKGTK